MQLSQYLLLYIALFSSIMAIIFSIQTHLSTDFVVLSEPLQMGIFFKNLSSIGLSSWELCCVKQDVVDTILDEGLGHLIDVYAVRSRGQLQDDKTNPSGNSSVTRSTVFDDSQRTRYANLSSSYRRSQVTDELGLDDSLASADFPYRDDDQVLLGIPSEYWSCQIIQLPSNAIDDKKWIIPRVFLMVGTIWGVTGFCFLVILIVSREKREKCNGKQSHCRNNCNQENELIADIKQIERFLPSLDTITAGYSPISSLFLFSYLFQCVTFIIFDSEICKSHVCIASTGAYSLVAACVLWVISGVLVMLMLRKVRENKILLHESKRKKIKANQLNTIQGIISCESVASTFDIAHRDMESSSLYSEQIQGGSASRSSNATIDSERGDTT